MRGDNTTWDAIDQFNLDQYNPRRRQSLSENVSDLAPPRGAATSARARRHVGRGASIQTSPQHFNDFVSTAVVEETMWLKVWKFCKKYCHIILGLLTLVASVLGIVHEIREGYKLLEESFDKKIMEEFKAFNISFENRFIGLEKNMNDKFLKIEEELVQIGNKFNSIDARFLKIEHDLFTLNETVSWIIKNTGMGLPPPYSFNQLPYHPPIV
ncbi:unnamed protein product [Meloidogyne enterolobii]|uniref:Uncharacterized protein n=1 Tax=Meloidogyne enterolobii TaxID=390850 RepID=A0ACB1AXN1_MELEN